MRKWIAASLFLVGVVLLAAPMLPAQVDDASRIMEQNKSGVLYLVALGKNKEEVARGTGFAVGEDIIVANYHIISQAFRVEAYTSENKKIKVSGILGVNKSANLVLLQVKGKPPSMILGNFDLVAPEVKLFAVGANEAGEINIVTGSAQSVFQVTPDLKVADVLMSLPLTFSGAPLMDVSGQVVGILTVLDRGLKFVLPINVTRSLTRLSKPVEFESWTHENYFDSLEGSFTAGRIAAIINDTGNAQKFLEKVLKAIPTNVEAQALLARVYGDQRDYAAAIAAYRRLLELDPNRAESYLEMGIIYLKTQKPDDALAAFEKAMEFNLNRPEIFNQMGIAYEAKKDYARAVEQYQKFLLTLPVDPVKVQFRLGVCALELGDFVKAANAFQETLRGQPRDYQTNYNLALALQKGKQYEQAEEVLKRLIQYYPEDAASYYSTILRMYDEAGLNDKAIEAARKVIELNPRSEVAVYNLGIMFQKIKRYDEAIAAFQEAIGIKPDYDYAWYNIGLCFSQQKKYRESIGAFQKYVEIIPDSAEGWLNVGINYMQLKEFANAVEPLKKCIAIRPDYGVALYNLAVTYLNLKADSSAREIYQTLVNVDADLASRLRRLLQR